jgi:hypothetical protein
VFIAYFSALNSNTLLELLYRPQVSCDRIVHHAILANLDFIVTLAVFFKYGCGTLFEHENSIITQTEGK